MSDEIVKLLRLRLLGRLPRFVESLQSEQAVGKVCIQASTVRAKEEAFANGSRELLELSLAAVYNAKPKMSPVVSRIAGNPLLISLRCFIQLPGYILIVLSGDDHSFPLTGMLAQLECLGKIFAGAPEFTQAEVVGAYCFISHGKIRIEFDGALSVRQRSGGTFLANNRHAKAVRLQRFERRRCGLGKWSIELLHRRQRLAQFAAQLRGYLAQGVQNFLFSRGSCLLLRQRVSVLAIYRFQTEHILTAQTGNRSGNVRLATRPLAKLAGHVGRELGIGRASHQLQCCYDSIVGKHVQERRLVQSNAERGLERVVKNRIAGFVGKVGQDDRVFFSQRLRSVGTIVESAYDQCDQYSRRGNCDVPEVSLLG